MTTPNTTQGMPLWKVLLCLTGCIAIFIAVAVIVEFLTFWIKNPLIKLPVREVFLRTPLTLLLLRLFIKQLKIGHYAPAPGGYYAPTSGMTLPGFLTWTGVGLLLSCSVCLLYYIFHLVSPFPQVAPPDTSEKIGILVKWISVSVAAGITEEVLFRKYLFLILTKRYSRWVAIVTAAFIFGLVHIVMLPVITPIDIVMVVFGGAITGIMFSGIYDYTRAIGYCAIVHVIWDIFFIGPILAICKTQTEADHTIWPYRLLSQRLIFSGGNFGIEAALPSLVTFLAAIVIFYTLAKRAGSRLPVVAQDPALPQGSGIPQGPGIPKGSVVSKDPVAEKSPVVAHHPLA